MNTEDMENVNPDETIEGNEDIEPVEPPISGEEPTEPIDPDNPDEPVEPTEPEEPQEPDWEYSQIPDFYDRVRMNLSSTAVNMSNAMIDYPENAPMAEMRIKARVPQWAELEGFNKSLFHTCIVYMTCYQLCYYANSKHVTEQTTPSLTLKYSTNSNIQKPCEHFLALIDDLVAEINDETLSGFFGFKVTEGNPSHCHSRCFKC